jgi:hypothetical protein
MSSIASSTVANGVSVSVGKELLHVLGQDVGLEVDDGPHVRPPQGGALERLGISETSKPCSSTRATVSEIPSTAIEPFSTT